MGFSFECRFSRNGAWGLDAPSLELSVHSGVSFHLEHETEILVFGNPGTHHAICAACKRFTGQRDDNDDDDDDHDDDDDDPKA